MRIRDCSGSDILTTGEFEGDGGMFQRCVRRAFLVPIVFWAGMACAQTDPGVPIRGLQVRIVTDSTRDKVVRFEYNGPTAYVRIETSEPGAVRNEFPFVIDPARMRAVLQAVRVPSDKNSPLFIDAEL